LLGKRKQAEPELNQRCDQGRGVTGKYISGSMPVVPVPQIPDNLRDIIPWFSANPGRRLIIVDTVTPGLFLPGKNRPGLFTFNTFGVW